MENKIFINARLESLLRVLDARITVEIYRQIEGGGELIKRNALFYILADDDFLNNRSISDAKVIGLNITLGYTTILIKEA